MKNIELKGAITGVCYFILTVVFLCYIVACTPTVGDTAYANNQCIDEQPITVVAYSIHDLNKQPNTLPTAVITDSHIDFDGQPNTLPVAVVTP